ncbi:MAG: cache domain-containing protein [Thermodesulfobacteriota bacterium]|nr:cache domain-containing protein [Thermodesulfobacteriota bacterium]
MVITCEKCGEEHHIDPKKITGETAKFRCRQCRHLITANTSDSATGEQALHKSKPEQIIERELSSPPKDEGESDKQKDTRSTRAIRFRFGLTAKLFTAMIIVSLVPLSVFWGITVRQTEHYIKIDEENKIKEMSVNIIKQVEALMNKNVRILRMLANMDSLISMDALEQEPILRTIKEEYPWMISVYTIDTNGINIASSDSVPPEEYSDKQYYQDIVNGQPVAWETHIGKASGESVLILAVPIKRKGRIVGVMANSLNIGDATKRIMTWGKDAAVSTFITDEKGLLLAQSEEKQVFKHKNLEGHPLIAAFKNNQKGFISFTNIKGEPMLGHVRETAYHWIVAIQIEESQAYHTLDQVTSFAYLLFGVTIVVVFIIAWFSGRGLSRPIIRLTYAANRISIGELDVTIDTRRKDEIGDLAEAVARMQDSIRVSIEKLRRRR